MDVHGYGTYHMMNSENEEFWDNEFWDIEDLHKNSRIKSYHDFWDFLLK